MAGQLKVNGVTLATESSGTVTLESPEIKDSSNNVILDQSGSKAVLKNVEVVNDSPLMFRNRIINGDMRIDQRNAGGVVNPLSTFYYTLDRWRSRNSNLNIFSIQQNAGSVTPPAGFTNYLGCTSLSNHSLISTESYAIEQLIEGQNISDLGWGTSYARTITLSFWVRSSLTGTFGGSLRNSAADRSYPYIYTISSANTWEKKSITIPGDTTGTWLTTNGIGVFVTFGLGSGTERSGTAGSWAGENYTNATGATSVVATSGATFYITGVQLEVGNQATPFEHRPYGMELGLCQRYYWRNANSEVLNNATLRHFVGYADTNDRGIFPIRFPVRMRTLPTFTLFDSWTTESTTSASVSSATLGAATSYLAHIFITSSAAYTTKGYAVGLRCVVTTGYLDFDAEL